MIITYLIVLVVLFTLELIYFKIADHFNIIDKPDQQSSHSRIVLRGGGIIFTIAFWLWNIMYGCPYSWLLTGVTLLCWCFAFSISDRKVINVLRAMWAVLEWR